MPNQNEGETKGHVHQSITSSKEIKKSPLQKAVSIFFSEDFDDIRGSVVDDYVKPRAKSFGQDLIRKAKEFMLDNITNVAEVLIFGKKGKNGNGAGSKTGEYNGQKINYVTYYTSGMDPYNGNTYYSYGSPSKSPDVISIANNEPSVLRQYGIKEYGKAQRVLGELLSLKQRYPVVYVGDYYQLIRVPTVKADFNYGWKSFDEMIDIVYSNGSYLIRLPKPVPVD